MMFKPIQLDSNKDLKLNNLELELKKSINKNIKISSFFLKTKDKNLIHCVYLNNPYKKGCILYAHGNYGNITHRFNMLKILGKVSSIIIFDYRGYGKSSGIPSVEGFYDDIETVWNYLIINRQIKPYKITIYGTSIGCGPSSYLCAKLYEKKISPYALVLESGFSSIRDMAYDMIPRNMVNILVKDDFNNETNIRKINNLPILISHSTYDEVIPFKHALKLYKYKIKNPKIKLFKLEGFHGTPNYSNQYMNIFKRFVYE